MRVNSAPVAIVAVMVAIFFIASSFTKHPDRELRAKQVNLMIRQIGHRLLQQAGDSTSVVLPVTEIGEGTFQLRFEKQFAFDHDSLLALSQNFLPKAQFPSGYTLTVHECMKADIVYGFKFGGESPDEVACRGRKQPEGCYSIEIVFQDLYDQGSYSSINLIFGGTLVLLGVTLLVVRFKKVKNPAFAALGKFQFDLADRRLLLGDEIISLTDKECKILELLNENFGELIPRETLMQKVWINEGVITGRSLDMFVSKLRKKLSSDPELEIANVHGKGYKLEKRRISQPGAVTS